MTETRGTVFHDGGCPLCNIEINQLKRDGAAIDFVDVSAPGFDPAALGVDLVSARYWLHWIDQDGQVFQGYEANLKMWHATGRVRLARVAGHPWVRPLGELWYRLFARLRHPIGALMGRKQDPV
ncbi:thiol-disulfide oxidoreductase DCC family protein [Litorivicinus lipolyticus]